MKKSKFNKIVQYDEKFLIYNFITTSLFAFNKATYDLFNKNEFDKMTQLDLLRQAGFVVDDNFDEVKLVKNIIMQEKRFKENLFNEITIFTTTACNARCYYCYEKNLSTESLTHKTMDAIVNFIIANYNGKNICLRWFGGEPLVNHQAISYICNKLNLAGINFYSRMISNGFLFNKNLVNKACSLWKLHRVQITLDGIENDYNIIKNYKSSVINPFARVIKNIHMLVENGINVSIRINYSVDDLTRAQKTIDFLSQEFANCPFLTVYCAALREEGKKYISDYDSATSPQLIMLEYLYKKNFCSYIDNVLPIIQAYPCEAWIPKRYFIYPNGDIYKCQHTTSDNLYNPIGNVFDKTFCEKEMMRWTRFSLPSKCKACEVYELCRGGCQSLREQNLYTNADCYAFKNSIDGLIILYYKLKKEAQHGSNQND